MELAKTVIIPLAQIEQNTGQIEGLPKNPRLIKDDKFKKLVQSISENPEMLALRELLVFKHNDKYVLIGGNMRFKALQELKIKDAPCKIIPETATVEQLKAYTIKDNNGFGEWDWDLLANEWDENQLSDWALDLPDMNVEEIAPEDIQEDDFDESESVPARTKPGDIWVLGDHRLMCGSSASATDMAELMDGEMADLWLTDPPYNVDYKEKEEFMIRAGHAQKKHEEEIRNDKMTNEDFLKFLVDVYKTAQDVMKPGAVFYIWHSEIEGLNFRRALVDVGNFKMSQNLVWVKNSLVMGRNDFQYKHEPCLYGWKEGAGHNWYSDRSQTTILEFDRPTKSDLHPTMKPIPLFAYQIQCSSKKGDIVLDSFGGSGTTMMACEQLGRKARLMELSEHYCDVIVNRWEQATGKEAHLLNYEQKNSTEN